MTQSTIEWTQHTWNPIVGCSILSPGCINCYAMKEAYRYGFNPKLERYHGLTKLVNGNAVWTGKLQRAPEATLLAPLKRKKPTIYFVNSMSDLFHEDCPDEWIDPVFAVMALTPHHTYQVLTKRGERMRDYCSAIQKHGRWLQMEEFALKWGYEPRGANDHGFDWISHKQFLPNVWLGVSTERQREADERIPHLLQTPAAVRFISAEPLLGPIDLTSLSVGADLKWNALSGRGRRGGLDWVIAGGESGKDARDNDFLTNARSLLAQCRDAGVPFFGKQNVRKAPLPPDLLIREFPAGSRTFLPQLAG